MLTIPVRLNVADSAFTDEVVQLYDDVSSAKYANLRFIGESEFRQLTFDGRAPSYEGFLSARRGGRNAEAGAGRIAQGR